MRLRPRDTPSNSSGFKARKRTLLARTHSVAGSDGGAEHWGILAPLIETCKMNGVDP